jgi:hypothetical protein
VNERFVVVKFNEVRRKENLSPVPGGDAVAAAPRGPGRPPIEDGTPLEEDA